MCTEQPEIILKKTFFDLFKNLVFTTDVITTSEFLAMTITV